MKEVRRPASEQNNREVLHDDVVFTWFNPANTCSINTGRVVQIDVQNRECTPAPPDGILPGQAGLLDPKHTGQLETL